MLFAVPTSKTKMINVRLSERMHADFKTACELRGASMSSLLHQFVVRTIREEREMSPRSFDSYGGIPLAPSSSKGIPLGNHEGIRREDVPHKKKRRVA